MSDATLQPILVCMAWRGGDRFARSLRSIERSRQHFSRVVISITGPHDGPDMHAARQACDRDPTLELLCTNLELPTMQHQAFWVDYLQSTGVREMDWIYWLAYDDEVRVRGIEDIIDADGNWPIEQGTAYFGPWAMRHESPDALWSGDENAPLESWTSFPFDGPTRLPVLTWIQDQLTQPTYMQMSGSVCTFASYLQVRDGKPRKSGPMRIEMATAAASCNSYVAEFDTPVSIIYGRSNSDRASYGAAARTQDLLLLLSILKRTRTHPLTPIEATRMLAARAAVARNPSRTTEEWRVRGTVSP